MLDYTPLLLYLFALSAATTQTITLYVDPSNPMSENTYATLDEAIISVNDLEFYAEPETEPPSVSVILKSSTIDFPQYLTESSIYSSNLEIRSEAPEIALLEVVDCPKYSVVLSDRVELNQGATLTFQKVSLTVSTAHSFSNIDHLVLSTVCLTTEGHNSFEPGLVLSSLTTVVFSNWMHISNLSLSIDFQHCKKISLENGRTQYTNTTSAGTIKVNDFFDSNSVPYNSSSVSIINHSVTCQDGFIMQKSMLRILKSKEVVIDGLKITDCLLWLSSRFGSSLATLEYSNNISITNLSILNSTLTTVIQDTHWNFFSIDQVNELGFTNLMIENSTLSGINFLSILYRLHESAVRKFTLSNTVLTNVILNDKVKFFSGGHHAGAVPNLKFSAFRISNLTLSKVTANDQSCIFCWEKSFWSTSDPGPDAPLKEPSSVEIYHDIQVSNCSFNRSSLLRHEFVSEYGIPIKQVKSIQITELQLENTTVTLPPYQILEDSPEYMYEDRSSAPSLITISGMESVDISDIWITNCRISFPRDNSYDYLRANYQLSYIKLEYRLQRTLARDVSVTNISISETMVSHSNIIHYSDSATLTKEPTINSF